jgi:hypothetical protein
MPGLDPGIHLKKKLHLKTMDGRVKPGHDATEDNPRRAVGWAKAKSSRRAHNLM